MGMKARPLFGANSKIRFKERNWPMEYSTVERKRPMSILDRPKPKYTHAWSEDAELLHELAEKFCSQEGPRGSPAIAQQLRAIARDLDKATPDGTFLEELAGKMEHWSLERVVPTAAFLEEITDNLRDIALALKRDPSQ